MPLASFVKSRTIEHLLGGVGAVPCTCSMLFGTSGWYPVKESDVAGDEGQALRG